MGPAKRAVEEEDSLSRRKAARNLAPLGTDERTRVTHDTRAPPRKNTHDTNDTNDDSFLVRGGLGVVRARRMVDSSARALNGARLRETLRRDGYALLRGFLDARDVESARAVALEALMASKPDLFLLEDPGGAKEKDLKKQAGLLRPDARALGLLARQDVAARAEVRRVTECDALFDVAARVLFSDDGDAGLSKERTKRTKRTSSPPSPRLAMTTAYKWLRAVAGGEFTGVHTDRVFLGGGSGRLVTAWIPLGDVRVADGALMVAAGSHADATFAGVRRTYGASAAGADGANSGWLTDDAAEVLDVARRLNRDSAIPAVGEEARDAANRNEENVSETIDWRTCDFQSGDVVLLALDVVHMSLTNVSGEEAKNGAARARVSVDTRWQPEGDDPDPRVRAWRVRREGAVETVTL